MSQITTSTAALSAAAEARLDAANVTISEMADWIISAIADNHENNNSRVSVYADWQEWGGAAAALQSYADGPENDGDSDWAKALRNDEINAAVADEVESRMRDVVAVSVTAAITDAEDLDGLAKALEEAAEYAREEDVEVTSLYDATNLPVFGGDEIDADGVFSWDETRKLVQGDDPKSWKLVQR